MEIKKENSTAGSLQISSDVLVKIATLAAMEIEGVADVAPETAGVKSILNRLAPASPVQIEMKNDVADITVSIVVKPGHKIPELCEKVQENVKQSVQSMTQITVARVNVAVVGLRFAEDEAAKADK